jgi:hypothetical protein
MEDNKGTASYFDGLRTSSKLALLYQTFYSLRRVALSLILVILKNQPEIQIFLMIYISLAFLSYILRVRPFESKILNFLEIFNECVILGCLYHMLIFTESIIDDPQTLYNIGWSMDVFLVLQFFTNVKLIGW